MRIGVFFLAVAGEICVLRAVHCAGQRGYRYAYTSTQNRSGTMTSLKY